MDFVILFLNRHKGLFHCIESYLFCVFLGVSAQASLDRA